MLSNITSYFSSKFDIRIGQVEKFVDFDTQINLVKKIFDLNSNKKSVVISFLGKARIGKSTLMNCFVSNLIGSNNKQFNTSNSVKTHCTNGIDILPIETKDFNIILLDVQGLDFKDSKNDCKLMLFVFMLSNLIIYNEKGILTNSVLASFQSLTSLLTYMHDDNVKPNLIFRSIDIDDDLEDYNPNDNLLDMLNSDLNDQYLNVRKSLSRLFEKIQCIPTYTLDKKEKLQLKSDNFVGFMSNESNGFKNFCNQLNEQISILPSYDLNNFIQRAKTVTEQINTNQNIDFRIFDLTSSQAYIAIRKWEDENIDSTKYNEIVVDGTQANWDSNIIPIINYKEQILKQFDNLFNLTTPSIRKENRERINEKFDIVITIAETKSQELSNKALNIIYTETVLQNHFIIFEPNKNFNTWSLNTLTQMLEKILIIISKTPYLTENKSEFEGKLKAKWEIKTQLFKQIHNRIRTEFSDYIEEQCVKIKGFIFREESNLMTVQSKNINMSFQTAINEITTKLEQEIISKLSFSTEEYHFNLLNNDINKIINIPFLNSKSIDEIIVESTGKIKKLSQLNSFITGNKTMGEIIQAYFTNEFGEKFNAIRLSFLSDSLNTVQFNYHTLKYVTSDYVKFKQFHQTHKQLYNSIIAGGNNVSYLNLFDDLNNYIMLNPSLNSSVKLSCLVRYMYMINETNLFNIYKTDDFQEKFGKIIPVYNLLQSYNQTDSCLLKYELVCEIVNMLFRESVSQVKNCA